MSKTVLVTGGSGFIGTVICKQLVEQGHAVINIDRKKKEIKGVTQYPFDISNHQVEGIIKLTKPDVIIHLAADHEVARSTTEPGVFYHNNVSNTIGLLNCAVDSGVKQFIFSSSSTVYGNTEQFPTVESTSYNPLNSYGRSKVMVEQMMMDYEQAYGIKCVSLRYFNAAGAMPDNSHGYTQDPASHLIPIVARKLSKDETLTVFGHDYNTSDGTCERDYTHVCDIADAHIAAINYLDNSDSGDVFNIGAGGPSSILEVIDAFERITGKEVQFNYNDRRPGDAAKTYADISKAKTVLGWEPKYALEDIVTHAWAWETKKRKKN